MVVKGLLGFCVSIAHNYIFIINNSKYVGPTAEKFVWFLFSVFVSITQFSDFVVIEGPTVRATAATFDFFFFSLGSVSVGGLLLLLLFFFFLSHWSFFFFFFPFALAHAGSGLVWSSSFFFSFLFATLISVCFFFFPSFSPVFLCFSLHFSPVFLADQWRSSKYTENPNLKKKKKTNRSENEIQNKIKHA